MNVSEADLPVPFLFNALKHHHGYQLDFIQRVKENRKEQGKINSLLMRVGRLMIDLYYGELTPHEIAIEVEKYLKSIDSYKEKKYMDYIGNASKSYRTISLCDGSNWTLLIGRNHGRYVHIHPSRGSKNTIRVGAVALKTAICLKIFYSEKLQKESLVPLTNEVRRRYLAEPPIKNEVYTKGLQRILHLF